jgi:HEAT repeat protein
MLKMGDLIIRQAPSEYTYYLKVGDTHEGPNGNDGIINTKEEADKAAEAYCEGNPSSCEKFWEYLEKSGYATLQSRVTFVNDKKTDDQIETCIKKLNDDNWRVRNQAVKTLWHLAESNISPDLKAKMVEPLIKTLEDTNIDVRGSVVYVLGELVKSGISPDLKAKMIDPLLKTFAYKYNSGIRSSLAFVLGAIARSDVPSDLKAKLIDPLINAFEDKQNSNEVRRGLAYALGDIGESNIAPNLKAKIIDPLINALGDEDFDVRRLAAEALTDLVDPDAGNPGITSLAQGHKSQIVDSFIKLLGDDNEIRRESAAFALEILSKADIAPDMKVRMVEPLILATKDKNSSVRIGAMCALRNLKRSHIPLKSKKRIIFALMKLKIANAIRKTKETITSPFIHGRDFFRKLLKRKHKTEAPMEPKPKTEENQ